MPLVLQQITFFDAATGHLYRSNTRFSVEINNNTYLISVHNATSYRYVLLLIKMRIDHNIAKVKNYIKPIASISTRISRERVPEKSENLCL
jgi:hypothetical protein